MSELRLFSIQNGRTQECPAGRFLLERELQTLFESNLEALLGVRFLASEYMAGPGRIDTLGIDENGLAVVIEYKLDKNRTVINQGMSYMAWLRSNKAVFWRLVFEKLGRDAADAIDESSTRLICIAADFTREDLGAYELMPNNIDLVKYRLFGENQLLLERVTSSEATSMTASASQPAPTLAPKRREARNSDRSGQTLQAMLANLSVQDELLLRQIREAILNLGEDVVEKELKQAYAYKRTRNFASIVIRKTGFTLFLAIDPDTVEMQEGMRDVKNVGHWGTGDLELRIHNADDIQRAAPLLLRAYEGQSRVQSSGLTPEVT